MSAAFVFVCQGGAIEPKAMLLAASLRMFVSESHELIAAIPEYPQVRAPSDAAIRFLHQLDIRTVAIGNTIDPSYPYAHKIECFDISSTAQQRVFLDSDVLCLRECRQEADLLGSEFSARVTDLCDIPAARWVQLYDQMGEGVPCFDHRSLISGESMPMVFNSGVVSTSRPQSLYRAWREAACQLNDPIKFPETRPFLDQISLPFAARALALDITLLSPQHHWPSAIMPIDILDPPLFAHYHDSCNLLGDRVLANVAGQLIQRYDGLLALLQADPFLSLLTSNEL